MGTSAWGPPSSRSLAPSRRSQTADTAHMFCQVSQDECNCFLRREGDILGEEGYVQVQDDEEPHQRMMTQRARVQIRNYLPSAENEGDAIEKLRAKVESFQNRNRARG